MEERGSSRTLLLIVALVAVIAIAWWLMARDNEADEETVYETDVVDLSGGELIVTDPDETGVPVELPQTEMTNVPAEPEAAEAPSE